MIGAILLGLLGACGSTSRSPVSSTAPSSLAPGVLHDFRHVATYGLGGDSLERTLKNEVCPNGFFSTHCTHNINILKNKYNYDLDRFMQSMHPVSAYRIIYNTIGVFGENRLVSGMILMPNCPIHGTILYYHPTEVIKTNVPSCSTDGDEYCMGYSATYARKFAALFASVGYIVVMPDYIGLGIDNKIMHPYVLYPEVNAKSGLDMLIAANELFKRKEFQSYNNSITSKLLPLILSGFSEGAGYALWASRKLQNDDSQLLKDINMHLVNTVVLSGAYKLKEAQLPMMFANITTEVDKNEFNVYDIAAVVAAKPLLASYVASAYGFYDNNQNYDSIMHLHYYRSPACFIRNKFYTIPDLFINSSFSNAEVVTCCISAAVAAGYGVNNSINSLIKESILSDEKFKELTASTDMGNWRNSSPITFVRLKQDSTVNPKNSDLAYANTIPTPPIINQLITVDNNDFFAVYSTDPDPSKEFSLAVNIDHGVSETFLFLAAWQYFDIKNYNEIH